VTVLLLEVRRQYGGKTCRRRRTQLRGGGDRSTQPRAQRSSQAAKDIKDLITNSTAQVTDGVDLVNRAGQSLDETASSIKGMADIVAKIASASAEQASGIGQVNKALTQMDDTTQQNSALCEQNAATAKSLEQQAVAMRERVGTSNLDGAARGKTSRRVSAAA